ncbi:hypothetical protein MC885_007367, partial [Smutsia gigantea]
MGKMNGLRRRRAASWLDPGAPSLGPRASGHTGSRLPRVGWRWRLLAQSRGEESSFQRIEKDTKLLPQPPDLQLAHPRHPKTWQGPLSGPPRPESSGQCPAQSSLPGLTQGHSSPQTTVSAGAKGGTLKVIYSPLVEEGEAGNSDSGRLQPCLAAGNPVPVGRCESRSEARMLACQEDSQ